jgi:hypothetical protein
VTAEELKIENLETRLADTRKVAARAVVKAVRLERAILEVADAIVSNNGAVVDPVTLEALSIMFIAVGCEVSKAPLPPDVDEDAS